MVFGSNVVINCADDEEQLNIHLAEECNVLDHTCLMPGCTVGRLAVTGTYTVETKIPNPNPNPNCGHRHLYIGAKKAPFS